MNAGNLVFKGMFDELHVLLATGKIVGLFIEHDGDPRLRASFECEPDFQNNLRFGYDDGFTGISNETTRFFIDGAPAKVWRPRDANGSWDLVMRHPKTGEEVKVFDEDGNPTGEFHQMIAPDVSPN